MAVSGSLNFNGIIINGVAVITRFVIENPPTGNMAVLGYGGYYASEQLYVDQPEYPLAVFNVHESITPAENTTMTGEQLGAKLYAKFIADRTAETGKPISMTGMQIVNITAVPTPKP